MNDRLKDFIKNNDLAFSEKQLKELLEICDDYYNNGHEAGYNDGANGIAY